MKLSFLVVLSSTLAFAEIHTMTLAQALARAAVENPDVLLARLEVRSAQARVEQTNEPNSIKVSAGSGLAGTYGFPMGINGNAPSLFQVTGSRNFYDRPLHYRVEQSKENARGSEFDIRIKQQDAAYRVASAFLDAEAAARSAQAAAAEVKNLEAVQKLIETRVAEGRELEVELKRARVNVARAEDEAESYSYNQDNAEVSMAQLLAYPAGDRVRPALEDRAVATPATQQRAVADALADNAEVRRLESGIKARMMEVKSYQAMRHPKIAIFGQYQLLSTALNNFQDYYLRYQPNNAQIGLSMELPLFVGKAMSAGVAMADTEIQKLQIQLDAAKRRIANDIDQGYRDLARAEKSRTVRRDSVDVALDDVRIALVQQTEGRGTMADVEAKRAEEQRAWRAYYEAQRIVDLARLNIQRATGSILAAR